METSNPKSAIVDAIKQATNILVTVSHNPSVDALAAALGFSLMLNKLDKHATAVFSGAIPPAISFLEPEKNFEGTVSSLRDFIIALDKEKADRLRYKVEGDVVRIYITPYKTTITQKDLEFSEGDLNVDLILALGVERQNDFDSAIAAHGRILHDAATATINIKPAAGPVGTIDWSDDKASSLCEMLMSLSEALQPNLLDEQIATALLTGIVAATDRFSNEHTSPRVMTMSAQLMAAGANQQLIAEQLSAAAGSKSHKLTDNSELVFSPKDETGETKPLLVDSQPAPSAETAEPTMGDIADEVQSETEAQPIADQPENPVADNSVTAAAQPNDDQAFTADQQPTSDAQTADTAAPVAGATLPDELRNDLLAATENQTPATTPSTLSDWRTAPTSTEATALPAADPVIDQLPPQPPLKVETRKRPIVGYEDPGTRPGSRSIHDGGTTAEPPSVDVFDYEMTGTQPSTPFSEVPVSPDAASPAADTTVPADKAAPADTPPAGAPALKVNPLDAARDAVNQALSAMPQAAAEPAQPPTFAAPPAVESPVAQPEPPAAPALAPAAGQAPMPPIPPVPIMPDFSTLPPLPGSSFANTTFVGVPPEQRGRDNTHQINSQHVNLNVSPENRGQGFGNPNSPYTPPVPSPQPPAAAAPGQFRIPGQ